MKERNQPSQSETEMCPHGNFPNSCEQCMAENSSGESQTSQEKKPLRLPDLNDPDVKKRLAAADQERFIRREREKIDFQREVREKQITEMTAEIEQLQARIADREKMIAFFEEQIREGEEFLSGR